MEWNPTFTKPYDPWTASKFRFQMNAFGKRRLIHRQISYNFLFPTHLISYNNNFTYIQANKRLRIKNKPIGINLLPNHWSQNSTSSRDAWDFILSWRKISGAQVRERAPRSCTLARDLLSLVGRKVSGRRSGSGARLTIDRSSHCVLLPIRHELKTAAIEYWVAVAWVILPEPVCGEIWKITTHWLEMDRV